MKFNKIFILILFVSLFCFTFFIYKEKAINFYGENFFLKWHFNDLAIKILEFANLNENSKANFLLGRIYFVKGNERENLFKSIKHFDRAISIFNKNDVENKRGQNPKDFALLSQSYYGRGLAYGFLGDIYLINAEKDFKKYIELEDKLEKETGSRSYGSWAGYNDLAWILYLQGDFKNGELIAKKGLLMSQDNAWLLNMLAVIQIEQNNCKEAVVNLIKAKSLLEKTDAMKWGEAYSGDNPSKYEKGKNNMLESINDNLNICKNLVNQ